MKILSHRGYWHEASEKNTLKAFKRSLEHGYGFESDIRDFCGKLIISHDLGSEDSINADNVFHMLQEYQDQYTFAVNIKADGLKDVLLGSLKKYQIQNYFCFDMSIPQMIEYTDLGIKFFTRQSEYEPAPVIMLDQAQGIWLDAFYDYGWITPELIQKYISLGKSVCIVSPELHQHPYKTFWDMLLHSGVDLEDVMLCTDLPDVASDYFY